MTLRKCKVEGCQRTHAAKGYCFKHYQRWRWGISRLFNNHEEFVEYMKRFEEMRRD